jgi:hypothetical protein
LEEFVTFIVGANKKKFLVHKDFACGYSPVLKTAFNSEFVEGKTQTYTMEDVSEEVFAILTRWLYTQNLDVKGLGATSEIASAVVVINLVKLWVLAERLMLPRLQNESIDLIEELRFKYNLDCSSMFKYVWESTTANTPLRRLFVDHCVWNINKLCFRNQLNMFPKEMLGKICLQFRDTSSSRGAIFSRRMASFHVIEEKNM